VQAQFLSHDGSGMSMMEVRFRLQIVDAHTYTCMQSHMLTCRRHLSLISDVSP
jgi:hypothetical protein